MVGRLSVSSMPTGGYLVTSAEWCYPDDFAAIEQLRVIDVPHP